MHYSRRKDVERLFRVFQGRFRILRYEFHEWRHSTITEVLEACAILHIMKVQLKKTGNLENEKGDNSNRLISSEVIEEFAEADPPLQSGELDAHHSDWIQELIGVEDFIRNAKAHLNLREAMEDHIWSKIRLN